jgi:hypothetical protein
MLAARLMGEPEKHSHLMYKYVHLAQRYPQDFIQGMKSDQWEGSLCRREEC